MTEAEREAAWNEWVETRPENVRLVARRLKPWLLYTLKPHGQRVFVVSFHEPDGERYRKVTCVVAMLGEFNPYAFDREVFGIDPDDLVDPVDPASVS